MEKENERLKGMVKDLRADCDRMRAIVRKRR